jgi:lysophospholipase L1-like esterase
MVFMPRSGYFVTEPGTNWTVTTGPPGDPTHVARFHVNRFGIRGRAFGDDRAEYRVLAVGGSTTECALLDDSTVWTHLLETGLDTTADGRRVWVGNIGHGGTTTRDHVVQLKHLLAQYPRIDVVVALVGVNDMASALRQGWEYQLPGSVTERSAEETQLRHAFVIEPGAVGLPWYKATGWWWLARRAKRAWRRYESVGSTRRLEPAQRSRSTIGASLDSIPPLERPLLEYRRNLNAMVDLPAAAGARVVFVTQPSAWRRQMTDAENGRLWFGWVGADWSSARAYYTTGALRGVMAAYNQTLLDVCRERGLACVDAAHLLPNDTTIFIDDVHFTERGSRLLAEALVAALRDRPPFGQVRARGGG